MNPNTPTPFGSYAAFEAEARERGFDAVLERNWAPAAVLDTHTHSFAVWAQANRGEMWLTVDGQTQHLRVGQQFTLAAGVPHAERDGGDGAAYWVGRRHPRGAI